MSKPRRAALYARFSTDLQRDASIDDQLRSCCSYAAKQGIEVVEMYSDRAVSGAGLMRSGIQKMLRDAQAGCFDIVVSEAMDRLLQTQFGCSTVRNKGKELYANMNTISQADLEQHVLDAVQNNLMDKDAITVFCTEYAKERNHLIAEADNGRDALTAELATVTRDHSKLAF